MKCKKYKGNWQWGGERINGKLAREKKKENGQNMKCKKCKGVSGGVEGQKNKITVMENLPGRKKRIEYEI